MTSCTRTGSAALAAIAALALGACGSQDSDPATATERSAAAARPAAPPGERLGAGAGDYVEAKDVDEWLAIGKVSLAFSGKVVGVEVGPAVTAPSGGMPDELRLTNTVLLHLEVDTRFRGDIRPGEIVPIALRAGDGLLKVGDPITTDPTDASGSSKSVAEFQKAYPTGTRVVAMGNPHPITTYLGESIATAVYPNGVPKRDTYLTGIHPQSLSVETTDGTMTGWGNTQTRTYDQLVAALLAATT